MRSTPVDAAFARQTAIFQPPPKICIGTFGFLLSNLVVRRSVYTGGEFITFSFNYVRDVHGIAATGNYPNNSKRARKTKISRSPTKVIP